MGKEIYRDGEKIGWIEEEHIYARDGKKLGYFEEDKYIYTEDGRKVAYVEDDKLHSEEGEQKVALEVISEQITGGVMPIIARAAIYELLGN